jgi:proline dehydrogenase
MKDLYHPSFDDTAIAFEYKSDAQLRKANFIFSLVNNPTISKLATGSLKLAINLNLPIEAIIKATAFDHFCGGISIEDCDDEIANLSAYGVGTILDYSVEGEATEVGFDAVMEETIRTIEKASKNPKGIPFSVFKVTGLASFDLLEKIQAQASLTEEEKGSYERVKARVNSICKKAHELNVRVLVDAEETWIQDTIDSLTYEMMRLYNQKSAIVFNTYQLYRTASLQNLKDAYAEALNHGYFVGAKLVRGAYMEKERDRALEKGYPNPIQPNKTASDKAYNDALSFSIQHLDRIHFMCGSHNEESNYLLVSLMKDLQINPSDDRIWFAQLYGMSDNISFNLAKSHFNVAKYVPYGPVKAVMPYLLRRAAENTSVAGQSSRELVLIRKEIKRRREVKRG